MARGAREVEGTAGEAVVAAVVAVEEVEGVGVEVGVAAGEGASVAVVEVEAAAAAAVGVEVAVVLVEVELCNEEALEVDSASSSSVLVRPRRPNSFLCGTLGVGGLGVLVPALTSGVAIFDLDYDAILATMYAITISAEGDCYLCVPPAPGIEAPALGASESAVPGASEAALSGTASTQVLHTFTLDSGASRSFFRNCTSLTLLRRPVAVSLADPSGGPVLAHFSTVLPCPAAPSGTLSGLYLPSFSTNLTDRHLATFTRRPGSSLYTLTTESPPVTPSGRVAASGQVFAAASRSGHESAPCSCRLLSHETLLWHHRLGHPSLPRLQDMASRVRDMASPVSPSPSPGACPYLRSLR
ncbi:unnamed protein product [Closterium sp. NIES-65]|nr:unnamed protein product [Closterium sp. NIES-65]